MKVEGISSGDVSIIGGLSIDSNNETGPSFSERLSSIDDRISALANGHNVELQTLLVDMEQAKLTLEYSVALRDKLIDAYKEITTMQV